MSLSDELRDPTLEELYTGPVRQLPDEIQQLPAEDTACTFCGVSYFVFAEVQTLQTTVKQYKTTFRDFVRFMERERSVARDLRQQTIELRNNYADLMVTCSSSIKQLSEQNELHRTAKTEALDQVVLVQRELMNSKEVYRELQILSKQNDEEQKMTHALAEQKLHNEISDLSCQVESSKLVADSQQAAFKEDHDRDQQRIRELESQFTEAQAQWQVTERQMLTERDGLKEQLRIMDERVELESSTARQLEVELTAIREELNRITAASDMERKSHSQMNSEIIQLKHQVQNLEKSRAQLLSENGRYKDDKFKIQDELNVLRLRAEQLQGQLSVSTSFTEKIKGDYAHDLEKLRGDHEIEINRIQCQHTQAIEELKTNQHNYVESLKRETIELQTRGEQSSRQAIQVVEDKVGI
ncbi:hypothetical protein PHPALM_6400 [Phytophthora palmivora]|uniref:Uncharacterized protein n=1 Tax=Phytophthora palmivora TaxID=4796 RepID=A0A2P4YF00_9STRA|nr:hypothetical protein PHPALM_6400 [Phytophthora palmivora]